MFDIMSQLRINAKREARMRTWEARQEQLARMEWEARMERSTLHIGEIFQDENGRLQWKVQDFMKFLEGGNISIISPEFSLLGCKWKIEADSLISSSLLEELVFSVTRIDPNIHINKRVVLAAGLLKADGTVENPVTQRTTIGFIERQIVFTLPLNELWGRISELVPSGTLTFTCLMEIAAPKMLSQSSQTSEAVGIYRLVQDLNNLLLSGDASDANIIVRGEEFRVHKNILGTRSPVLSAMFKTSTSGKDVVVVEDCEPETFRLFLQYVYTGGVVDLTFESATELYELATKYKMEGLEELCLEIIKKGLSVETFCRVVAIAVRHSDLELIQLTTDLFAHNMERIIRKGEWQDFLCEHPIQANELLVRAYRIARKDS